MNKSYLLLIITKTTKVLTTALFLCMLLKCQTEEASLPIQLEAEIQHVTEFGGSDGSIDLTATGGRKPFRFLWSTTDTLEDLSGIPAGIYSVTISDQSSQTVTDTFEVIQPELDGVMDVDGNIYSVITIGEQTWMGENLRVKHAPDGSEIISYVYIDDPDAEERYGRLYSWDVAMNGSTEEEAQGICPYGWHIPDDDEFKQLEIHLGMTQAEVEMANTWRGSPVGTSLKEGGNSGYDAQLAGRRSSGGRLGYIGEMEYMWTSTEYGKDLAWRRCLNVNSPTVGRWNTFPKNYGFSVRCVQNKKTK
jgi:uncharacterized protein (TIGR02145 family)